MESIAEVIAVPLGTLLHRAASHSTRQHQYTFCIALHMTDDFLPVSNRFQAILLKSCLIL